MPKIITLSTLKPPHVSGKQSRSKEQVWLSLYEEEEADIGEKEASGAAEVHGGG